MGIIKRQSLKTSIVNYIGVLIGVVFFNFIFPHLISEEYLGLIGLIQNLTYILVSIPMLGLAHLLLRYFSVWNDDQKVKQYNGFAFSAMAIALVIFSLLFMSLKLPITEYYKSHSSLFLPYFFLVIPMVVFQAYTQYLELFAMVKLRVAVPAFLREIVVRVLLIGLVYLFAYKLLSEVEFIYGFVAVYGITFLFLLGYSFRILDFKLGNAFQYLKSTKDLSTQLNYGGGMLLLMVCSNVHNFLDGIILPAYLGLGVLGIYMRPLVLGQMIQVPYRAISQISLPIIREAIVNNDLKKVYELNKNIGLNLFLIGCFLFALLISNADNIFNLLPQQYHIAKSVLYIIAAGRLLDMAFGLNSEILNSSKYYHLIIVLSVVMMLMTIGLNILLIPKMGMNGAAIAVSVSLIVFNILKSAIIYSKYKFHCFSLHYLTLIAITLMVVGVLYFVPVLEFIQHHMFINSLLNVMFKGVLGTFLFLIPVYVFRVSPDFNDFVKLVLTGKILKGGHKMEHL
jgi:O-antigen/teichoic acid export membrane protein